MRVQRAFLRQNAFDSQTKIPGCFPWEMLLVPKQKPVYFHGEITRAANFLQEMLLLPKHNVGPGFPVGGIAPLASGLWPLASVLF